MAQDRLADLDRAIASLGDSFADLVDRIYCMDDDEYEPTEIGLQELEGP